MRGIVAIGAPGRGSRQRGDVAVLSARARAPRRACRDRVAAAPFDTRPGVHLRYSATHMRLIVVGERRNGGNVRRRATLAGLILVVLAPRFPAAAASPTDCPRATPAPAEAPARARAAPPATPQTGSGGAPGTRRRSGHRRRSDDGRRGRRRRRRASRGRRGLRRRTGELRGDSRLRPDAGQRQLHDRARRRRPTPRRCWCSAT